MVKYLLTFLTAFLILSSFSFAAVPVVTEGKLKSEYGPDLTKIPWYLRFDYEKKYNSDWKYTYYFERKAFLMNYETNLAKEQIKDKIEAKAERDKEKERLKEKTEQELKERARLKARADEKRAEAKADADQLKAFQKVVSDQKKEIQDMEREFAQEKQQEQQASQNR